MAIMHSPTEQAWDVKGAQGMIALGKSGARPDPEPWDLWTVGGRSVGSVRILDRRALMMYGAGEHLTSEGPMRILALVVAVALAVGVVFAGETQAPAKAGEPAKAMGKTHEMTVEVVSFDAKAKTITIKDENGETKTAPVLGKAIQQLKNVKAGQKFTLTCQDNEKGEHQGVTAIKPATPPAG